MDIGLLLTEAKGRIVSVLQGSWTVVNVLILELLQNVPDCFGNRTEVSRHLFTCFT